MSSETSHPPDRREGVLGVKPGDKFLLIVALLVVSLASLRNVPFNEPWGVDLMNIVLYHECAQEQSPYSIPGAACGDPWDRGMYYPPLLFYSFAWTRSLSLERAMQIWSVFQLFAFAVVLYAWVRRVVGVRRGASSTREWVIFSALLLVQFPVAFALERGGSDVWAVVFVTLAALSLVRHHYALAGAALGVATAYKLYPAFTCAVIVLGLLIANWSQPLRSRERWRFVLVGASAFGAFLVVSLLFYSESKLYFTKVLPGFADTLMMPGTIGHSIGALTSGYPRFGMLLMGLLVVVWAWAAARAFQRADIAAGVAGALAISTYFQKTSWDYNLVTTYPLLVVMFLRAQKDQRWGLLALGLIAIVGERELYGTPGMGILTPHFRIGLQLAFLVLSAIVVAAGDPQQERDTADLERAGA
jgi:hypothetical protein